MLTDEQIDGVVLAGSYHNAAGGIYATSVYDFARAVEAATLATVTLELLGAVQMANHGSDCATLQGGTRCDCWKHALNEKARAFLSGATKESTDA